MANRLTIRVAAKQLVAPIVSAGPDITQQLPNTTVSIQGTANDPDGTIQSIVWSQIAGPLVSLNTPNQLVLQINNLTIGTYVFQITVTDDDGQVSSDQMTLQVTAANVAPTVNAGSDQTFELPTSTTSLSGTASDSDGFIQSTSWTVISSPAGSSPTIANPNSLSSNVSGLTVAGTYVFRLTAVDNDGAISSDEMTITVDPLASTAPVINSIGPNLNDSNDVRMGRLDTLPIDVQGHTQPWTFEVEVSDVDNHNVVVDMRLIAATGPNAGSTVATDSKVVIGGNGTVVMEIVALFPLTQGVSDDYTLEITATDIEGLTDQVTQPFTFEVPFSGGSGNGGLDLPPTITQNNACYTQYEGVFVVPQGETGSLSVLSSVGNHFYSGIPLTNVGPGSYPYTIEVQNSGSSGFVAEAVIEGTLSGGSTGTVTVTRGPAQSPDYDGPLCLAP